jgi:hypothetical protein
MRVVSITPKPELQCVEPTLLLDLVFAFQRGQRIPLDVGLQVRTEDKRFQIPMAASGQASGPVLESDWNRGSKGGLACRAPSSSHGPREGGAARCRAPRKGPCELSLEPRRGRLRRPGRGTLAAGASRVRRKGPRAWDSAPDHEAGTRGSRPRAISWDRREKRSGRACARHRVRCRGEPATLTGESSHAPARA